MKKQVYSAPVTGIEQMSAMSLMDSSSTTITIEKGGDASELGGPVVVF